jgi:hypothetical protein
MQNHTMKLAKCTTPLAKKRPFYDMNLVTSYDINSAVYMDGFEHVTEDRRHGLQRDLDGRLRRSGG